jgi:hypothetical protein
VSTKLHSADSCYLSIKIVCPKGNSDFWGRLIWADGQHKNHYLLNADKKSYVKKGQYLISLSSQFGDRIDTVINLESEKESITIKVPFKYIFEPYSNSVFLEHGDTIEIKYTRHGCCGGNCCMDKDNMTLSKDKNGSYFAKYYETIIRNEICFADKQERPKIKGKQLDPSHSKIIDEYFQDNSVQYNKKKVIECVVKIGRHIYCMNYNTYEKFRTTLLN